MIDMIYFPKPIEQKPEWFNGFIRLEKHHKEKYNWHRYVYLSEYYSKNYFKGSVKDSEKFFRKNKSKFGSTIPHPNTSSFVNKNFQNYYSESKTKLFGTGTKIQLGGKTIGNAVVLNAETNQEEQHRYFYCNDEYFFRQLEEYDRPQIKDILVLCSKELGRFHSMAETVIMLNNGLLVGAFNTKGEMKAIGSFIIVKNYVGPEPMFYIHPDARGQGMWNIYNDYTVELGLAVEAEYIFAQCLTTNEAMVGIYTANGYVRDEKIKQIGKTEYYTWKYPLKTNQQSFF